MSAIARSVRVVGIAVALAVCVLPATAQDGLRDPTVAPAEPSAATGSTTGPTEGMTVLVRDGKPYLVVGTRLHAVGDKVGAMRVEKITESEVWLHDGRAVVKVPRFAGIERTGVLAKPACTITAGVPDLAASATKPDTSKKISKRAPAQQQGQVPPTPSVAAPCEDTQP
jgi:hypothetical protein